MRVSDLITDPLLRLELATPSTHAELETRITSAVATESIDPAAYLSPGTLIMTTGMALNFDDPRIWTGYVERLLNAEVAALAFGLGKPHTSVPVGLMNAAKQLGLPVLGVPAEVPFLHLQNIVHRALAEEDFQASRLGWAIAEECTDMAATGQELDFVLDHMAHRSGVTLRIVDDTGSTFAVGEGRDASRGESAAAPVSGRTADLSLPLALGDGAKWHLGCFRTGSSFTETQLRTILAPAAAVLSMILARILETRMWESEGSSELLAALESTDETAAQSVDAALRSQGIDLSHGARLISVRSRSAVRVHLVSWRMIRLFDGLARVTPVETTSAVLLLVTPENPGAEAHRLTQERFRDLLDEMRSMISDSSDSLFISERLTNPRAMNLFAALHGSRRPGAEPPAGVHLVNAPDLHDIIRLIPPLFTTAIAESLLDPVLTSSRSAELLASLAVLIDTTSIAHAAARLQVHRNTARAHRDELEELLGINLTDGADRSMCALALAGLER